MLVQNSAFFDPVSFLEQTVIVQQLYLLDPETSDQKLQAAYTFDSHTAQSGSEGWAP